MPSVKIGREFFAKAFNDYANKYWAFSREILQNSIDAPGTSAIRITVTASGPNTVVTVVNDGAPMTSAILFDKLLTLGGSGKNFQDGSTGGFGKAKEILYLTHLSYVIRTGDLEVTGSGADYEVGTLNPPLSGTSSTITWEGDHAQSLINAFRRFCALSQWNGRVILNGEELPTKLAKGHHRRDFEWARVYTNRQYKNLLVVRIDGRPMFTRPTGFAGCVIVELTGKSGDRLTSNRDSLLWRFAGELDSFLTSLAVDKKTALRTQKAEFKRFAGEKLRAEAAKPRAVPINGEQFGQLVAALAGVPTATNPPMGGIRVETTGRTETPVSIGPEFILKNTTGRKIPVAYDPGAKFSPYARSLALSWARVIRELYRIDNTSGEFSVGFLFDEENEAEYSRSDEYGSVYYLSPAKLKADGFARRYKSAFADRHRIISIAVHEYVHGKGFGPHDEDYAGEITRIFGLVMENQKRIYTAYKGKQK